MSPMGQMGPMGPMRPGGPGGPGITMTSNATHLFITRGNTVYCYEVPSLKLVSQAELPSPRPPAARQPDSAGRRPEGAPAAAPRRGEPERKPAPRPEGSGAGVSSPAPPVLPVPDPAEPIVPDPE